DMAIEVARVAGTDPLDALAAQAESPARLCALRNGDGGTPAEGGHFHLATECCRGEGNGQLAMQIIAFTLEDAVFLEMDLHIQIARRAPVDTRLTIAGGTDPHAVVDACGNLHLQRLLTAYTPHPVAGRARVGNFLARAVAGRAVLLDAEEALLHAHDTRAITGVAGAGARAGLGAAAMADIASLPARHADLGVETVGRLLQRDVQCVLEIGSAIHLRPASSAASTK